MGRIIAGESPYTIMSDKKTDKKRISRKKRALQKGGIVKNAIRIIFGGRITSDPKAPIECPWQKRKYNSK